MNYQVRIKRNYVLEGLSKKHSEENEIKLLQDRL